MASHTPPQPPDTPRYRLTIDITPRLNQLLDIQALHERRSKRQVLEAILDDHFRRHPYRIETE